MHLGAVLKWVKQPSKYAHALFRNVPVTPTPSIFPKVLPCKWGAYCRTNGRRTAVQMGGILQGFPFFEAWKPGKYGDTNGGRTAVQIGGVLPYFLDKL